LADVAVPIAWAVAAALVGRALIVYGLLGGWRIVSRALGARRQTVAVSGKVARDEADLPLGWLHVIFWSGLRGAVSTALALSLPLDFPNRALLQGITFGVVLFTLVVQATTAELVLARWGRKPTDVGRSKSDSKPKTRKKPRPAAEIAGPPADPGSAS
jgi:NhaP-type Na+/H+ or K+/H+ antiporter